MRSQKNSALTEPERERFLKYAAEYGGHWRDHASAMVKWLLGTLITVNTAGLYFAMSANIHPLALENVFRFFFAGLAAALLAAMLEVVRSSRLNHLAEKTRFDPSSLDVSEVRAVRNFFSSWRSGLASSFLCLISVILLFFGGTFLVSGVTPCSSEDLQYSISRRENVARTGHSPERRCYFYEIKGLADDPLERALQERQLVQPPHLSTPDR